jgi:glutamate-1-semialdehyde 2,1-aminomutase
MLNQEVFATAKQLIPGGVNSPVRSFASVGGIPFFTAKAKDCYLYDIEDKKYIDYVCSWGANIAGHAQEYVTKRLSAAISNGLSFGTPTFLEVEFARQICALMPSIEKVRLVNSGTEAVMSAIRLVRGSTNRDYIVKFNGCYHGHCDSMLVSAGSGVITFGSSNSAGVPNQFVANTLVVDYNDVKGLTQVFEKYGDNIAGVIFEPYAGNMNLVSPTAEFIQCLNTLPKHYGALLICDEVMTGFRVALGGAQSVLAINPDITILGKVVGGGMPLAAFGGRAAVMDYLAPLGSVYQAGTLSGNPIAVTSGLANLELIQQPNFYAQLSTLAKRLTDGISAVAKVNQIELCTNYVGGMFGIHFQAELPNNLSQVSLANVELFKRFFHGMLDKGIFFAPSMFEAGFICIKHSEAVVDKTIECAHQVFASW